MDCIQAWRLGDFPSIHHSSGGSSFRMDRVSKLEWHGSMDHTLGICHGCCGFATSGMYSSFMSFGRHHRHQNGNALGRTSARCTRREPDRRRTRRLWAVKDNMVASANICGAFDDFRSNALPCSTNEFQEKAPQWFLTPRQDHKMRNWGMMPLLPDPRRSLKQICCVASQELYAKESDYCLKCQVFNCL